MAPSFDYILPPTPPKRPGENYVVWTAASYQLEVEQALADLIEEAQGEAAQFRPDDLAEEILDARKHLAIAPDKPPGLCIYSDPKVIYTEDGLPLFQPTHVLPGRIINVWYVLWEKEKYVGNCRLERALYHRKVL